MEFDDARLENAELLARHDPLLRQLALAGSRIRVEAAGLEMPALETPPQPRGIIAVGAEARLIRAVLEPLCPVPFVAWALAGLPGWVGPLDLVIVLASGGPDAALLGTVGEAVRRGASVIVAAPPDSPVADAAQSTSTLMLPTRSGDPLAAAVVVLNVLHRIGIGPEVHPESAAEAADLVAEACSPHRDLSTNPAKHLAIGLAEATPLVWGGSVLAARASRRVAEALRRNSGRPALAADAEDLAPILESAASRDTFADPFEQASVLPPVLIVLDDGRGDEVSRSQGQRLVNLADSRGLRICRLSCDQSGTEVDRYVSLLQQGLFGAAYLGIGLGTAQSAASGFWEPGR